MLKRIVLLAWLACGVGTTAHAAIALDTTAVFGAGVLTNAYTCTGANRILFVVSEGDPTAIAYAGVSLTLAQSLTMTGGQGASHTPLKLWWLKNPAAGSNNIVVTSAGSGHLVVASYTGAQQTGSLEALVTNSSSTSATALTTAITTVTNNDWILVAEWGYAFGVAPTAGTNLTLRGNVSANGSPALFDSNAAKTPAGSFSGTTNLAFSAGEAIWHIMAAFSPVAITPPTSFSVLTLAP